MKKVGIIVRQIPQLPLTCTQCGGDVKSRRDYPSHIRHYHQMFYKNKYSCPLCQFEHIRFRSLQQHVCAKHKATVVFTCSCCSLTFSDKTERNMHMDVYHMTHRMHSPKDEIPCVLIKTDQPSLDEIQSSCIMGIFHRTGETLSNVGDLQMDYNHASDNAVSSPDIEQGPSYVDSIIGDLQSIFSMDQ